MSPEETKLAKTEVSKWLENLGKNNSSEVVNKVASLFGSINLPGRRNNIQDFLGHFNESETVVPPEGVEQVPGLEDDSTFLDQLIAVAEMDESYALKEAWWGYLQRNVSSVNDDVIRERTQRRLRERDD